MRHFDRLGFTAGARGEDHHERVVRLDLAMGHQRGRGADPLRPVLATRVDHGDTGQVDAVEQVSMVGAGEDQLAVDARDIAG